MILKKIIIKDQKELYRHKNYLLTLDLEFNSTTKEYSNSSNLSFEIEHELIEFLKNSSFSYNIVEEKITDFKKQILAKYKTIQIDDNNIFIVEKSSDNKIYLINQIKNRINIADLTNSSLKMYKVPKNTIENSNLSINVLEILASNKDDFKELFTIFSILENQNTQTLLFLDKLKKFKYFCITKVNELQRDMFLCNCVPSFFPETKFFIKGNRVFSDYTKYFLTYQQEIRIWKYLYSNKDLVAVYKEPTLYELFIGRKIYILDEFKNRVKVTIKSAQYLPNKGITITLSNGVSTQKISQIFTKEELLKRVIEARD